MTCIYVYVIFAGKAVLQLTFLHTGWSIKCPIDWLVQPKQKIKTHRQPIIVDQSSPQKIVGKSPWLGPVQNSETLHVASTGRHRLADVQSTKRSLDHHWDARGEW